MTEATKRAEMPLGVIVLAGALLLFTMTVAGMARITNNNHVILPPTQAVASRDLLFKDLKDGGVDVSDAGTSEHVYTVLPTTGGFLRGVLRGLVRDHRKVDRAIGYAFHLTRWADGRLSLEDPTTHESFELEAFGSTNELVFAQFLETSPKMSAKLDTNERTGTEMR